MSFSTIPQLCNEFQGRISSVDSNEVKLFCDHILVQVKQNEQIDDDSLLNSVVCVLNSVKMEPLNNSAVLDHSLWILLRDHLLSVMRTYRTNQVLQKSGENTSSLLSKLTRQFVNDHLETFKRLWLHKASIDELKGCLQQCTENFLQVAEEFVQILNNLLLAYQHLMRKRNDIQNDPLLTVLFEAVVHCFSSCHYELLLARVGEHDVMNIREEFFFERCPMFVYQGRTQHRRRFLCEGQKILLPLLNLRLPFRQVNKSVINALSAICGVIFMRAYQLMNNPNFYDQYEQLLSHLFAMLSMTYQTREDHGEVGMELIQGLIEDLSNFIAFEQYVGKMRELQVSALLLTIVEDIPHEETRFQTYRVLAAILTEKDIKTLAAPDKIVTIFLTKLKGVIDKTYEKEPLDNVLIALRSLVQHDQIKDEIAKQQGLPLLIRCAIEPELIEQGETNQWSLDILLALTFNKQACDSMKKNTSLAEHIKTVLANSADEETKRSAEGMRWKLHEQEKMSEGRAVAAAPSDAQYDVMISYCHQNKDLCYALYDRLVNDGYRVWLDRENMHHSPMEAMAHAIENCHHVVVCMSDAYKQSPCCRLEANYAFNRRRTLIPLVVTSRYKPDGWLGIMISDRIYIDVPKLSLDVAYENLKKEIEEHLKQVKPKEKASSQTTTAAHDSISVIPKVQPLVEDVSSAPEIITNYPRCVNDWTAEHVRSFLIDKQLKTLLPVVVNMNGRVLRVMYSMCVDKPEFMYDRLKADTPKEQPLNMSTYLRFLDEIKEYVSTSATNNRTMTSTICTLF